MGALDKFDVVSDGHITGLRPFGEVRNSLENKLKLSTERAERVLSTGTLLKKSVTKDEAIHYKKIFLALGVGIVIKKVPPSQQNKDKLRAKELKEIISNTFSYPIPRLPVSMKYRLGVISVSFLSLIAPLIYLSLVFFTLGATLWYGYSIPGWFESNIRGANQAILVLLPFLMLVVLLLFLVKPFFSTYKKQPELELSPKKHYRFFHLINTLAESMGLPSPAHIYVNNDVNAFVAPRNGFFSLFKRDLTLTIGLPLLAATRGCFGA